MVSLLLFIFIVIYAFLYTDLCWFMRLLSEHMHFKRGFKDKKQVDGSPSTTRSVIEPKRTHKSAPWLVKTSDSCAALNLVVPPVLKFVNSVPISFYNTKKNTNVYFNL
jgi:hypothetical protein